MKYLFVLSLLALCISCDTKDESGDNEPRIDIASIIRDTDTKFIYFENGDTQYYFSSKQSLEGFSNRYLEESEQLNLNMRPSETAPDHQYFASIYMSISNLFDLQLPAQIGGEGPFVGHGELQLLDQFNNVSNQFGPEDDYNYVGSSAFNEMEFTITGLDGLVFEAEFEGTIATKTGRSINVQNGVLRIELEN